MAEKTQSTPIRRNAVGLRIGKPLPGSEDAEGGPVVVKDDQPTPTTIRGDQDALDKLRAWAEPLIGALSDWSLIRLQMILEDASDECGMIPQYRKVSDA